MAVAVGEGFGYALAFVVAGARTEGVDITPVFLGLWTDKRVTVDFYGSC